MSGLRAVDPNNGYFMIAVSALLSAFIPIVIAFSSGSNPLLIAFSVKVYTVAFSFLYLLVFGRHKIDAIYRAMMDASVARQSFIQALLFVTSIVTYSKSIQSGRLASSVVIMESWPIVTALIIAPMLSQRIIPLNYNSLIPAALCLGGVFFIVYADGAPGVFNMASIYWALASMVSMAFCVAIKAKAVDLCDKEHGLGPVDSFVVLQIFAVPIVVVSAIPLVVGNAGMWNELFGQTPDFLRDSLLFGGIGIINSLAAISYSYGTLKLKAADSLFVWYFSPAVTIVAAFFILNTVPNTYEFLAIAFIISGNLLLALRADNSFSYRYSLLVLMATGALCVLVEPAGSPYYFDLLAVLCIFVTILLSFLIDKASSRLERENQLLISLYLFFNENKVLRESDRSRFLHVLDNMRRAKSHYGIRKSYIRMVNRLRKLGLEDTALFSDLLNYVDSKVRGVSFGQLVGMSGAILCLFALSIGLRPDAWYVALFVTVFNASVSFAYFSIFDFQSDRYAQSFRRTNNFRGKRYLFRRIYTISIEPGKGVASMIVVLFVVACLVLAFLSESGQLGGIAT